MNKIQELTREQIEDIRKELHVMTTEYDDLDILCDMALRAVPSEIEAAGGAVLQAAKESVNEWAASSNTDNPKFEQAMADLEKALYAAPAALPEGYVMVPKEIFDGALNYIRHVGANHVMRGEPHPQQWLVDGLLAAGEKK